MTLHDKWPWASSAVWMTCSREMGARSQPYSETLKIYLTDGGSAQNSPHELTFYQLLAELLKVSIVKVECTSNNFSWNRMALPWFVASVGITSSCLWQVTLAVNEWMPVAAAC